MQCVQQRNNTRSLALSPLTHNMRRKVAAPCVPTLCVVRQGHRNNQTLVIGCWNTQMQHNTTLRLLLNKRWVCDVACDPCRTPHTTILPGSVTQPTSSLGCPQHGWVCQVNTALSQHAHSLPHKITQRPTQSVPRHQDCDSQAHAQGPTHWVALL